MQRVGLRNTLTQLHRTPLREWPTRWFFPAAVQHGMGPPPGQRGSSGTQESHEAKLERITKRVQQLPTEEFMDRKDIEALPLHQLKVLSSKEQACAFPCTLLERNSQQEKNGLDKKRVWSRLSRSSQHI